MCVVGSWGPVAVAGRGGLLVVLCRGGGWGAGAWWYMDLWVRAHGLRFGAGLGSVVLRWRGICWMWADIGGW